jgi:hypothetical protein
VKKGKKKESHRWWLFFFKHVKYRYVWSLSALSKFQEATICWLCQSVHLSAWTNSFSTEEILWISYRKRLLQYVEHIKISLMFGQKYQKPYTETQVYIIISPWILPGWRTFPATICRESQHTKHILYRAHFS